MAEYLKDKELEQHYQEVFKTTGSPGWELIVKEMKELAEPLGNIRTVRDIDDLRYRQGMLNILDRLVSYRDVVQEDYDALREAEDLEDANESV